MTTIINTPTPTVKSDGGLGMIIGVILIAAVAVLFFVYGLPAIKRLSSPQINIPSKIEVQINK
jgi:hypothetical protein